MYVGPSNSSKGKSENQFIDAILSSKSKQTSFVTPLKENREMLVSQMTPGQQLCFVIRKLQHVSKMQNVTNNLFGCILALDIGFTVFMLVILKYLLIRNLGFHVARLREMYMGSLNGTFSVATGAGDNNDEIMNITSIASASALDGQQDMLTISPYGWSLFLTFDVCFSLRIIVLIKFLGNVNSAAMKINVVLANALGKAQKLVDLVSVSTNQSGDSVDDNKSQERMNNNNKSNFMDGNGKRRPLITSVEADTILAFLTVNSSQPIAFSVGGGFLTFSGSTIMLIVSVIISYVVFLLQA